ncbi:MAG: glycosyltransferase family 2 protein [bacterium]
MSVAVSIVIFVLKLLLWIITIWLAAGALHWSVFALIALGRMRSRRCEPRQTGAFSYLVMIPGYRMGNELAEAARAVRLADYDQKLIDTVVIADHCDESVCRAAEDAGGRVIRLSLERSTKVASMKAAFEDARGGGGTATQADAVLILDGDNLVAPGFFTQLTAHFRANADAVQGRRVARNWDTPVAQLDMISEALNNAVFRRARVMAGLPCSLIGSAMAFRYSLLERHIMDMQSVGGFDKELEMRLIAEGRKIAYAEKAVCFDEKLPDRAAFAQQKRRWLSAQFVYLGRTAGAVARALFTCRGPAMLDKWLQWLFPPRVLLLMLQPLLALLICMFMPAPAFILAAGFALMAVLHAALITREGLMSVMPSVLMEGFTLTLQLVGALLRLRGANRRFIHTPHEGGVSITEIARAAAAAPALPAGVLDAIRPLLDDKHE